MAKIKFYNHRFQQGSRDIIDQVNAILSEYASQGFRSLTVRQVYYQMVSRDMIPNTMNDYKRIVKIVTRAREAGLIDWDAIQDMTRRLNAHYHLDDLEAAVDDMARTYLNDLWRHQDWFVMVMIEKEALANVVGQICNTHDIPWTANRGYPSATHSFKIAQLLHHKATVENKKIKVLHLGDLDPSGWDMTRDIINKMLTFGDASIGDTGGFVLDDWKWQPDDLDRADAAAGDFEVDVIRLALNMDQVQEFQPPPNPAKQTDSRHGFYIEKFGHQSWELDALSPTQLSEIITTEVDQFIDQDQWEDDRAAQEDDRAVLEALGQHGSQGATLAADLMDTHDIKILKAIRAADPELMEDILNAAGLL